MPITDPILRAKAYRLGQNPDEWENPYEPQVAPPAPSNPAPSAPKTSAAGAFFRSAARAVPSTAAGILGGVGSGSLGGSLFGPPGSIIGGISGGIAAAIAARKAQDAIAPSIIPGYTESQETDITEHPIASAGGDVAAGLPFLGASLKSLPGAARALVNPLRNVAVDARDLNALANVGLGAALPVGTQLATDPDVKFSQPSSILEAIKNKPLEYGINALGGALLNEPTKIGQRLGLSPNVYRQLPISSDNATTLQKTGNSIELPKREVKGLLPEKLPEKTGTAFYGDNSGNLSPEVFPTGIDAVEQQLKNAPPRQTNPESNPVAVEHLKAQQELQTEQQRIQDETAKLKAEAERLRSVRSEMLPATKENESGYDSSDRYYRPEDQKVPAADPTLTEPVDNRALPDKSVYPPGDSYYKGRYADESLDKARMQEESAAPEDSSKSLNSIFQERVRPLTQGLRDKGIPTVPTKETVEAYQKLGQERNVNIAADQQIFTPQGKEVAGESIPRQGTQTAETKINPRKAGIDTLPHEIEHNFDDDLELLGDAKAKAFIKRADRIFEESPVYQEWKAAREKAGMESSVKEFRTTLTGEDVVRRLYSTDKKGDIRNWFDDIRSAFRIKAGKGDVKDVSRVMSAKLLYDAPFDQTFTGKDISKFKAGTAVTERNQQEESLASTQDTDSPFYYELPKILSDKSKLGLDTELKIEGSQLYNRIKNLRPSEIEVLDEAGLKDYLSKGRHSAKDVAKWIDESGPKVEVRKLEANPVDKEQEEHANLHHTWYEKLDGGSKEVVNKALYFNSEGLKDRAEKVLSNLSRENYIKAKRYIELGDKLRNNSEENESATARYTMVNPKPLDKMPGAVDLLVRVPLQTDFKYSDGHEVRKQPKYISSHYPKEGKNLLAHVRGYMETTKDGKKIFHVFEVQSDWGQAVREQIAKPEPGIIPGDPLLKHYERLAIKAAIEHARKNGADAIAFSDAETAMITEGHDKAAKTRAVITDVSQPELFKLERRFGSHEMQVENQDGTMLKQVVIKIPQDKADVLDTLKAYGNIDKSRVKFENIIGQEKGMRLHYDQTIPKIAEELLGEKGQRVDFGEHQNAVSDDIMSLYGHTEQRVMGQSSDITELRMLRDELRAQNPNNDYELTQSKGPRPDLIFKNTDGTPKTNITARQYNLKGGKDSYTFTARRYQEDSPLRRFAEESPIPKTKSTENTSTSEKSPWTNFMSSEIDKIEAIGTPKAKTLADSFKNFYDKHTEWRGKLVNDFSQNIRKAAGLEGVIKPLSSRPKEYLRQSTADLDNTLRKAYEIADGKSDVTFTPAEQKLRAVMQKSLAEVRKLHKELGVGKPPSDDGDPNYVPHITKYSIIRKIQENRDAPEAQKLIKDFVDYQKSKMIAKGSDPAKAETKARDNLEKILEGYQKNTLDIASQYGPIDRAEGFGLPKSWREDNMIHLMERYLDRVSRRFAHYQAIEKNPNFAEAIKTVGGDSVKRVYNNIKGNNPESSPNLNALLGVVKSSNLGPLSGARDLTATLTLGMQHMGSPLHVIKATAGAIKNISENIADGYKTGRIRTQLNDLEWNDNLGKLRRIRDILTDVQGRNWFEKVARGVAMGQGKVVTLDFHSDWTKGQLSKQGQAWFKKFGKDVDWMKPTLTNDEVAKIAAGYVDSIQGMYDYRGLPHWSVEGQLSPVFALARWSIEKWNNYQKNVVEEALRNKNYVPLLNSTIGMVLGGSAVAAITEVISGRKDKLPTTDEIATSAEMGNDVKMALTYKMAGLASMAGHMGMIGDIIKATLDKTYAKTKPRWYDNMLLEAGNNAANTLANTLSAAGEGEVGPELVINTVASILEDNLQVYRLAINHISEDTVVGKKENVERSNKMRDIRMFKTLEGENIADYSTSEYSEKFEDKDLKKFKRTDDLNEAATLLPDLVKEALEKSKNHPERLKSELEKIKRNSYQTMPSPDEMPISFARYLSYLQKSQSPEKAQERLMDYLTQREKNSVKSRMVPSIR